MVFMVALVRYKQILVMCFGHYVDTTNITRPSLISIYEILQLFLVCVGTVLGIIET